MTNSKSIIEKILFIYIIIDILFLPYLPFLNICSSYIFVIIWFVFNLKKIKFDDTIKSVLILILLMLFSTCISIFIDDGDLRFQTSFLTSLKRFLQYSIAFTYFIYIKYYFSNNTFNFENVLIFFIFFVSAFAVLFYIDKNAFAEFKILINPNDNHTKRWLLGQVGIYRFNYLISDPNNLGYLMCSVYSYFIFISKKNVFFKFFITCLVVFVIISTVSIGSIILFIIILIYKLFDSIYNFFVKNTKLHYKNLALVITISLITIIILLNSNKIFDYLMSFDVINSFISRILYYDTDISGGRFNDLILSLEYIKPGFIIFGSGKEGISAEIGHLYFLCMYGILSYLIFMFLVFKKNKNTSISNYICMIPFLVAFTINISIGEQKYLIIMLLFSAYLQFYSSKKNITNIEKTNLIMV